MNDVNYEEMFRVSNREWAEDHSALQELCKQAGCSDYAIYGDSYGVPGIQALAQLLFDKIGKEL